MRMMKTRRILPAILAAFLVVGVILAYLLTSPPPTTVLTLTVSGSRTTTTVLGHVTVISGTGLQEVLCAETSYYSVGDVAYQGGPGPAANIHPPYLVASETNTTNSVGYVVTSISTDFAVQPGSAWTVMKCTFLP
jgi:hypothetical protein